MDQFRTGSAGSAKGIIVAGAASNSGKTLVALGLIRALQNHGIKIAAAKCGPDYIDPQFLSAATGQSVVNLDPWAMSRIRQSALAAQVASQSDLLLVEGVMGLFDGAPGDRGSTYSLASMLDLPIILVVPADGIAQSVAAIATGFSSLANEPKIVGAIVTRIASDRHEALVREGFDHVDVPLLGVLRRSKALTLKSRHLGLVQAEEVSALSELIDAAGSALTRSINLDCLLSLAKPVSQPAVDRDKAVIGLPPLGQRIAIAKDTAFGFAYPHLLNDWRDSGAELSFFSPLANETPDMSTDSVYLPGGYPELYAGQLAGNHTFMTGIRQAAEMSKLIYGECGGYMVLGEVLTDGAGINHEMAGLLPVRTSFENRELHLGYRQLRPHSDRLWTMPLSAHEFHYASLMSEDRSRAGSLFASTDVQGQPLGDIGLTHGSVCGSFAHIIDALPGDPD